MTTALRAFCATLVLGLFSATLMAAAPPAQTPAQAPATPPPTPATKPGGTAVNVPATFQKLVVTDDATAKEKTFEAFDANGKKTASLTCNSKAEVTFSVFDPKTAALVIKLKMSNGTKGADLELDAYDVGGVRNFMQANAPSAGNPWLLSYADLPFAAGTYTSKAGTKPGESLLVDAKGNTACTVTTVVGLNPAVTLSWKNAAGNDVSLSIDGKKGTIGSKVVVPGQPVTARTFDPFDLEITRIKNFDANGNLKTDLDLSAKPIKLDLFKKKLP